MVAQARTLKLLSDEHFTVDGTLVEAWASLKSFKRKVGISLLKVVKLLHDANNRVGIRPSSTQRSSLMDVYLDRITPEKLTVLCASGFFLDDRRVTFVDEYGAEL